MALRLHGSGSSLVPISALVCHALDWSFDPRHSNLKNLLLVPLGVLVPWYHVSPLVMRSHVRSGSTAIFTFPTQEGQVHLYCGFGTAEFFCCRRLHISLLSMAHFFLTRSTMLSLSLHPVSLNNLTTHLSNTR